MRKILYSSMLLVVLILIEIGCGNKNDSTSKPDSLATENNQSSGLILDLKSVSGKELSDVEKQLGRAKFIVKIKDKKANCGECPKYSFKNGDIEVIFINQKADWITIKNMGNTKFQNCSIDLLGDFNCINRTFKSDDVIKWNDVNGFKEIVFFRKYENGKPTFKVDYAYIKTFTE